MELTGKAKIEFDKFFLKGVRTDEGYDQFLIRSLYSKVDSMKYVVYENFFDSV